MQRKRWRMEEKKELYLRHKFRWYLASQQKRNTRVVLVGGKDPSWGNLYIDHQHIHPRKPARFLFGVSVFCLVLYRLAFYLKRKEKWEGRRESILWRHLSRFKNPGNAALLIIVAPSPGSHTPAGNIVGQPFSPFCNFPGCRCCSGCCCCSGVGTSGVPGTKSTFSISGARAFAPRKTAFAAGIWLFCSEVGQMSSGKKEASEGSSPRAVSARVISL